MPEYRRNFIEGGTYFFTVVTYLRRPILTSPQARALLHTAWETVKQKHPFEIDAICLLPDHIHCIWTLPENDQNFSVRWSEIKKTFSRAFARQTDIAKPRNESRIKRGELAVWQRRFWEHTVRDLDDLYRHFDYIHYNPVKHGLVRSPVDWPWSSFHRYVKMGLYPPDWAADLDRIREIGYE